MDPKTKILGEPPWVFGVVIFGVVLLVGLIATARVGSSKIAENTTIDDEAAQQSSVEQTQPEVAADLTDALAEQEKPTSDEEQAKKDADAAFAKKQADEAKAKQEAEEKAQADEAKAQQEAEAKAKNESTVINPGAEVVLKYDKETDEAIYLAVDEESFQRLVSSYSLPDPESRWEMILDGRVFAVKNGVKARTLEVVKFVNSRGIIKVRILEGDEYNQTGFVLYSLVRMR